MADVLPLMGKAEPEAPKDRWAKHREDIGLLVVETNNFIVYLRKQNSDVDWETTDEYDIWLKQRKISPSDCQSKITYFESFPIAHFSAHAKQAFRCQLGEAMVFFLRGNTKKSSATLKIARCFYVARSQEYARSTFITVTAITAGSVAFIASLLRFFSLQNGWAWTDPAIVNVGVGSSLGALLFSLVRMKKASIDPDAETRSHVVEAIGRIIVSLIVGVVAVCAVRGGFLLTQVVKDGYGFFLLCLTAGASERFGGAIVERFDQLFTGVAAKGNRQPSTRRKLATKLVSKEKPSEPALHDG